MLDRLWAGWRASYLSASVDQARAELGEDSGEVPPCLFCVLASGEVGAEQLLEVGELTFTVLNLYPYSSGHLMVLPRRHVARLDELDDTEAADLMVAIRRAVGAVEQAYRPDGLNVGMNLGRAAGAGLPDHLHVHVVPRWAGDTNFMTALAEARVLPESLDVTRERLRSAWPS